MRYLSQLVEAALTIGLALVVLGTTGYLALSSSNGFLPVA